MIVRSQHSAITTVGLMALLLLSGVIPWSKTLHPDKFADAQSLQEVSQTLPVIKQRSTKKTMSDAQLQFGFKLFSSLTKEGVRDNLMVSPTSVALALSMLYNGASGITQQEMANVLAVQGMSLEEINAANKTLQNSLQTQEDKLQLTIANSLWAKQGFSFRHQFLKTNQSVYNAQITNLNFANPEAVGIINRWVGEKTQGKIERIIDRINADDVLFLINAIYFGSSRLSMLYSYKITPKSLAVQGF